MSKEALKDFEDRVTRSLLHINDLRCTTSQVDLPVSEDQAFIVYLSGDTLYLAAGSILYVYYLSDTAPRIGTYSLTDDCYSGIISENHLYLGGNGYLKIFELTSSLTEPLKPVKEIKTKDYVYKILRVGH